MLKKGVLISFIPSSRMMGKQSWVVLVAVVIILSIFSVFHTQTIHSHQLLYQDLLSSISFKSFYNHLFTSYQRSSYRRLLQGNDNSESMLNIFQELLANMSSSDPLVITGPTSTLSFNKLNQALDKLETTMGWVNETATLRDPSVLASFIQAHHSHSHSSTQTNTGSTQRPLHDMADIVILTHNGQEAQLLSFLQAWKSYIEPYHLIILQEDEDYRVAKPSDAMNPPNLPTIPGWVDYELFTRKDIDRMLGDKAWIMSPSSVSLSPSPSSSIMCFALLVSEKEILVMLHGDSLPADRHPGSVNVIEAHIHALLANTTMGHTYSARTDMLLRGSAPHTTSASHSSSQYTVISNGKIQGEIDSENDVLSELFHFASHDSQNPTSIPPSRSLTANMAFHKKLIGPALFIPSIPHQYAPSNTDVSQALPSLDGELFAEVISSFISDHLHYAIRSKDGPTVKRTQVNTDNPWKRWKHSLSTTLSIESQQLHNELFQFLSNITLSTKSTTAGRAYLEISQLIFTNDILKDSLYYKSFWCKLSKSMDIWLDLWEARFGGDYGRFDCYDAGQYSVNANNHGCIPGFLPTASMSSIAPRNPGDTCAIFTITHNEAVMLPLWLRYYLRHVSTPTHLWILDHNTIDNSTHPDKIPIGVHVRKLYGEAAWMPHYFINRQVEIHQQRLFRAGYRCVLFTEVDEIVIPDPNLTFPNQKPIVDISGLTKDSTTKDSTTTSANITLTGLQAYLHEYATDDTRLSWNRIIAVQGRHLAHAYKEEPEIDYSKNILAQRSYWRDDAMFHKPLLARVAMRYSVGHHFTLRKKHVYHDPNLYMLHLHSLDYHFCADRELAKFNGSVHRGKKDEDDLGMNSIAAKKTFEEVISKANVCGLTMLTRDERSGSMKAPLGEVAEKIPDRFKAVEL